MSSITTDYSGLYSYSGSSLAQLLPDTSNTSTQEADSTPTATGQTDTVTLSAEAMAVAQRDYLGLSTQGKLSQSDFETASQTLEKTVSTLLAATMENLGIDSDQEVSLYLNDDNAIEVQNNFSSSSELETALNKSHEFIQAFTGLTANNEILDYTESLQNKSVSLADYIDSNATQSDLLSIASRYQSVKAAGTSIGTLWAMGRNETPYTYSYRPGSNE